MKNRTSSMPSHPLRRTFVPVFAGAALLLAGCADDATTTAPLAPDAALEAAHPHAGHGNPSAHQARGDADFGTTPGWFRGQEVVFSYGKPFFCSEPPESGAESGCVLGAEPEAAPRPGRIPVVYVMTPLGFRPDEATLHCPEIGNCINHPSTLDASRVFGAGAESIDLPAHSHIVDDLQGNWWEIEVIGVTEPSIWDAIVAEPSLARVRELQAAGMGITGDIPTNLYLFFSVRRGGV